MEDNTGKFVVEDGVEKFKKDIGYGNITVSEPITLGENNIFGLKQDMLERTTEVDFKLHQLEDISAENRDFDEECQILESIMNNSSSSSGEIRTIGGDRSPRARKP